MTEKDLLLESAITTLNKLGYFDEADTIEALILEAEYGKIPDNVSEADFAKWNRDRNADKTRIAELEYGLAATKDFIESIINANPYSTEPPDPDQNPEG